MTSCAGAEGGNKILCLSEGRNSYFAVMTPNCPPWRGARGSGPRISIPRVNHGCSPCCFVWLPPYVERPLRSAPASPIRNVTPDPLLPVSGGVGPSKPVTRKGG